MSVRSSQIRRNGKFPELKAPCEFFTLFFKNISEEKYLAQNSFHSHQKGLTIQFQFIMLKYESKHIKPKFLITKSMKPQSEIKFLCPLKIHFCSYQNSAWKSRLIRYGHQTFMMSLVKIVCLIGLKISL